jgi:hypothetical protein
MKKFWIALMALGLTVSASAQHYSHGPVLHYYPHPRVGVGIGLYAPVYSPFWGYGPYFGYPPYGYYGRPSKLTMQIEDIRNDYQDRIWAVKHDKSLPKQERKARVRQLKHDREAAIDQAKRDYYRY